MTEGSLTDDVEKLLNEQKSLEDRRQALIADLLKEKEAAIKDFDEKLARLAYQANSGKPRRSHHKKAASPAESQEKPKAKA